MSAPVNRLSDPFTGGSAPPPPAPGSLARAPQSAPGAPVAELDHVEARDAAGDRGRPRGGLSQLSLVLGPGVHTVLGAPEDGTIALIEVLAGARPPLRGRVRVAGRDPRKDAAVRARLGALLAEPRLPPARDVNGAVRLAMRARGEAGVRVDAVLDPLGLAALHGRAVGSLGHAEARAVELALALSTPAPLLLALFEPFAGVGIPVSALVRQRLRELGDAGVCVVVASSSVADARALGGTIRVLERGLVAREAAGDALGLGRGPGIELMVWVRAFSRPRDAAAPTAPAGALVEPVGRSGGVRELAAELALRPEVQGVTWEHAPGADVAELRVRGADADACALAVIDAALDAGVVVDALVPVSPGLAEVRAAGEALFRARRAKGVAPPAPRFEGTPVPQVPVVAPSPVSARPDGLDAPGGAALLGGLARPTDPAVTWVDSLPLVGAGAGSPKAETPPAATIPEPTRSPEELAPAVPGRIGGSLVLERTLASPGVWPEDPQGPAAEEGAGDTGVGRPGAVDEAPGDAGRRPAAEPPGAKGKS